MAKKKRGIFNGIYLGIMVHPFESAFITLNEVIVNECSRGVCSKKGLNILSSESRTPKERPIRDKTMGKEMKKCIRKLKRMEWGRGKKHLK
jgi:hypothetical protein